MPAWDMILLGLDNLWRTKLRTILTTLGVIIGIGALTSMVSFGTGMQKNVTDAINENDLFTSLSVTSGKVVIPDPDMGEEQTAGSVPEKTSVPLNDSTLRVIQKMKGVEVAFPEISFPVKIRIRGRETRTMLRALPATMKKYKPYSQVHHGKFFSTDSSREVVIDWTTLKNMKILVQDAADPVTLTREDSSKGFELITADSVIGKPVQVISAVLDAGQMAPAAFTSVLGFKPVPVKEATIVFQISGILKKTTAFSDPRAMAGIIIPINSAEKIPRLGFSSVWDLLAGNVKKDEYSSIYVRLHLMSDMAPVREEIRNMGLHTFSISDQLKDIRRSFLILNGILGAIGTIALVVAALGIVNTMVMSILERRREIGIMKAIGGSEKDIKMIFIVEAGTIGIMGALFGLLLGWVVTRLANLVANAQFLPKGEPPVDFFFFPLWLILGAIVFSVVISLAAGLYPAIRAARVDPIQALRHD